MSAVLFLSVLALIVGLLWWAEIKAHERLVKQITEGQEDKHAGH